MPTLILKLSAPQPPQRHPMLTTALTAALTTALTQLTAELLGKRGEVTAVLIEELAAGRWAIGAATPARPTAWLEVSITAGTNTEAQKARFIEAAFAELQRQLAPDTGLAEASYIIVREVAATDWGYGGQTQRARQAARRDAAATQTA